jgi:hypothetical protein
LQTEIDYIYLYYAIQEIVPFSYANEFIEKQGATAPHGVLSTVRYIKAQMAFL